MNKKPNRNPRVAVTLTPEVMKILDDLSAVLDKPKAAFVAELLDASLPALHQMASSLRIAKDQPSEAKRLIEDFTAQALADISQPELDLDANVDGRTVKGRRTRSGAKHGTP